ncbi:MAG: hypothetical protein ACR2L6_02930 [Gemmatimonadaceae bacterium]
MTEDMIDEARLRELRALTERLSRETEPPAEAWGAIRAQIERDEAGLWGPRGARRVHVWQRPAFLIAASLALVAGSSALTYVALRGRGSPPVVAASGPAANTAVTTVSTLTRFTGKENEYLRRVNGLVAVMESKDIELAPETIAKVKESLAVIDAAILEARAALARDPANRQLIEMLESSYEKKLDLLQRTTEMARS